MSLSSSLCLVVLVLAAVGGLAACSGGGAAPAQDPAAGASSSAAFAPLDDGGYVPSGDFALPPGFPGAPAGGGASAGNRATAGSPPVGSGGSGAPGDASPVPTAPSGPRMVVTWEALAVERERFENPSHRRGVSQAAIPNQRIVLVNESHPMAEAQAAGRSTVLRDGTSIAVVPDEDMMLFIRGMRERGFFQRAHDSSAVAGLVQSENARGRITLERGDRSWTLVSMRGQGLNEQTRDIPAMYSQLKQSIMLLRNRTPTLNVRALQATPLR